MQVSTIIREFIGMTTISQVTILSLCSPNRVAHKNSALQDKREMCHGFFVYFGN